MSFRWLLALFFEMIQYPEHQIILVFKVNEDSFYFFFGLDIYFKIGFGPYFGMAALQVLTYHYKGHQEYLKDIGQKKPEDESGERIKLQGFRTKSVPSQPDECPGHDNKEEAHGADMVGNPDGKLLQGSKALSVFFIGIFYLPVSFSFF